MHITRFPTGLQRFALDDLPLKAWPNAGGSTREICVGAVTGHSQQWDWRISVADIIVDGPFSIFDGIVRHAVLVDGQGVTLCGDDALAFDSIGKGHTFAGEIPVRAKLDNGPVRLFNAMSRRGAASVEVGTHLGDVSAVTDAQHIETFFVARGEFEVVLRHAADPVLAFRLRATEGIVLRNLPAVIHLTALDSNACLVRATAAPLVST